MKRGWRKPPSERPEKWVQVLIPPMSSMFDCLLACTRGDVTEPQARASLVAAAQIALGDADDASLAAAMQAKERAFTVNWVADRGLAWFLRRSLNEEMPGWREKPGPDALLRMVRVLVDTLLGDGAQNRQLVLMRAAGRADGVAESVRKTAKPERRADIAVLLARVLLTFEEAMSYKPTAEMFHAFDLLDDEGNVVSTPCLSNACSFRLSFARTDFRDPKFAALLERAVLDAADRELVELVNTDAIAAGRRSTARVGNVPAARRLLAERGADAMRAEMAADAAWAEGQQAASAQREWQAKAHEALMSAAEFYDKLRRDAEVVFPDIEARAMSKLDVIEGAEEVKVRAADEVRDELATAKAQNQAHVDRVHEMIVGLVCNLADVEVPPSDEDWVGGKTIAEVVAGGKRFTVSGDPTTVRSPFNMRMLQTLAVLTIQDAA